MKSHIKIKRGGKGKSNNLRNRAIVILRRVDPDTFTFESLGMVFGLNKKTAFDIFERDKGIFAA